MRKRKRTASKQPVYQEREAEMLGCLGTADLYGKGWDHLGVGHLWKVPGQRASPKGPLPWRRQLWCCSGQTVPFNLDRPSL